ncbi:MAG: nucleotide sugar dehydrogenase [candidate division Zixibacteria bacterium]|nr:nucleotide sugar dehydrogenase [candidate division Zixibacteria bacterium]
MRKETPGPENFNEISIERKAGTMKISVIGTGYVGLVAGTCLAEFGHEVTCIDRIKEKIDCLKSGKCPIHEEGLEDLIKKNAAAGRLDFSTDLATSVSNSQAVFLGVGTPEGPSGKTDLSALRGAARQVAQNMRGYTLVVIKSTVPVGTAEEISRLINHNIRHLATFDIVSNPEFLRQGTAVYDFLNPERVILGASSETGVKLIREIYESFVERDIPIIETTNETAEVIKYAANSFLAVKISFINEMASICQKVNADISQISRALGMDRRIAPGCLNPGPGFGGSCLPKDVKSLIYTARGAKYRFRLGRAALDVNKHQHKAVVDKLRQTLGSLRRKRIALLGVAFKANTDDTRESPAIHIARRLYREGAELVAYDPVAMKLGKIDIPEVAFVDSAYDACYNADATLLLTEWQEFRELDFARIKMLMARPVLHDTRNCLDGQKMIALGFEYKDNGRMTRPSAIGTSRQVEASSLSLNFESSSGKHEKISPPVSASGAVALGKS